jgi:hypothetical protein
LTATTTPRPPPPLWLPGDVVLLYALSLLGAALVLASAWATTAADDVSTRIAWINLGVAGLIVAGTGNAFWLMAGRRAVGQRRARLLTVPRVDTAVSVAPPREDTEPDRGLAAVAGGRRFHRKDCALVADKAVTVGARSRHERAGRRPCGVCQP